MSCHHVGSTNRPAAAPRLCVRSCLSIRSCVNVQSRAQEKCRRCHATRFPDEDSWLRLNLHRILGIPTLSRARAAPRRRRVGSGVGARARASRGGVRWHTAARTPVASHSQPLSLRRGAWAAQGAENLLTYLLPGPHRAVCAQTGANTRRPPAGRGHEFTRGHVQHDVAPRAWRVPAVARPAARRRVCAARR